MFERVKFNYVALHSSQHGVTETAFTLERKRNEQLKTRWNTWIGFQTLGIRQHRTRNPTTHAIEKQSRWIKQACKGTLFLTAESVQASAARRHPGRAWHWPCVQETAGSPLRLNTLNIKSEVLEGQEPVREPQRCAGSRHRPQLRADPACVRPGLRTPDEE